jgi:hypothetical protein
MESRRKSNMEQGGADRAEWSKKNGRMKSRKTSKMEQNGARWSKLEQIRAKRRAEMESRRKNKQSGADGAEFEGEEKEHMSAGESCEAK